MTCIVNLGKEWFRFAGHQRCKPDGREEGRRRGGVVGAAAAVLFSVRRGREEGRKDSYGV